MPEPVDLPDSDGSMETILASIRRIIREDEVAAEPAPAVASAENAPEEDQDDELMVLEPSMMRPARPQQDDVVAGGSSAAPVAKTMTGAELAAALFDDDPPAPPAQVVLPPAAPVSLAPIPDALVPKPTLALPEDGEPPLLAPQARAAALQSVAALQDAVRPVAPPPPDGLRVFRSGGPSLEELVRDELRTELKSWLDANLPPLVERIVRQEIERLVRPG